MCRETESREEQGEVRGKVGCSGCPNDQLPVRWHNLFLIVLSFFGQTRWSSKGAAVPPSAMRLLPVFPKCKTIRNHRRLRRLCVFVIVFKERKSIKRIFFCAWQQVLFFLGFFLTSRPERVEFPLIGLWSSSAISPTPILTPAMQRCAAILQLRFSFTFHAVFSKFSQSSFEFFGQVFHLLNLTGSICARWVTTRTEP